MSGPHEPKTDTERGRRWTGAGPHVRRFHAFGVGLAKTGTSSLAECFAEYRSGHEFMFQETVEELGRLAEGRSTALELREFLRRRDAAVGLELDSASFHHFYIEHLLEEFPSAAIVYTVRDCLSWTESFLQMMLRNYARRAADGIPEWQLTLGRLMVGVFDPGAFASHARLVRELPDLVEGYLSYWARANRRVLDVLPAERSLCVRTGGLSSSLPNVARFVGADPARLRPDAFHANAGDYREPLLATLDPAWLSERAREHCGAVTARLFPGDPLATPAAGA